MDLSVVPYVDNTSRGSATAAAGVCGSGGGKYRECMRNHAAAIGGQAYDGCGEFMPGGEAGSIEALKCAACGCHRNFHRRDGSAAPRRPPLLLAPPPPPPYPAAAFLPHHPLPVAAYPVAAGQVRAPAALYDGGSRAGSETPPRAGAKRCRTRFTAEQKEKMQAFAEKLGWRINKHDDVALQEFCVEVGVKRHVLKVWIHNNKNHLSSASAKRTDNAAAGPEPISV